MGNCVPKPGFQDVEEMIKVVTPNGGIMELYAPITAECITNEFSGHAIFQKSRHNNHCFSPPLLHNQELFAGQLYYLLPLIKTNKVSTSISSLAAEIPYRMSFDSPRLKKRSDSHELCRFPSYNNRGVWKVNLLIRPEELSEILSHDHRTEALIDSARTVARCGTTGASSVDNSDQWSANSSFKALALDK